MGSIKSYSFKSNILSHLKIKHLLFFLLVLFILLVGRMWLCIGVIIFQLVYWGVLHLIALIKSYFLKKVIRGLFFFIFIFSATISIKFLIFEMYRIPSSSMESTLFTNDVIIVNKLKYGPRLPRSPFEIPWINIAFYQNKKARDSINANWWSYKRLSGYSEINNGDVVLFTMSNWLVVKRCMAKAGDTLKIRRGDVYINNILLNPSTQVSNKYKFNVINKTRLHSFLDSLEINISMNRDTTNKYIATLTLDTKNKLKKLDLIDSVEIISHTFIDQKTVYPHSIYHQWDLDNYGPFIVPKKGMTINLTSKNYALYNEVINMHENIKIEEIKGYYYLNGIKAFSYTFKKDYYFMMGDNRKDSYDSRRWGFVPENKIIGKVQCVLFSNYQGKFQWNRFLKAIN